MLDLLKNSAAGLYIVVVGSARDIAEAVSRDPELFQKKCRGIYLNAGSGSPDPATVKSLEWNVVLDPAAYAKIFEARCPIFWMPCLEDEDRVARLTSRPYATHFRFLQSEILDHLPKPLRAFFGWMHSRDASSEWLQSLSEDFDDVLAVKREEWRMMYSTACFFDLAGLGVTTSGRLCPKTEERSDWVYRYQPVNIECNAYGVTTWKPAAGGTNRFIFHVLDTVAYPAAMTVAMRSLISAIKI